MPKTYAGRRFLGDRVRALRIDRCQGPGAFAALAGIGRRTLHRIETDPDYRPSPLMISRVAHALGTDPEEIAVEVDDEPAGAVA